MKQDLIEVIGGLPCTAGVYFFYDDKEELIYIGKSINIKKRVQQHFAGKDRKSLKIQLFTKKIACEPMGSELIALLYESDLIKKHQPIYNRSQRRTIYQYGLYRTDINGYKGLTINKIDIDKEEITSFSTLREAKEALFRITETYFLCQKVNSLYKTNGSCFQYQIKECFGACVQDEPVEKYNARVDSFLSKVTFEKFTKLFEVSGRNESEKGLVYIENGVYKGFGFCSFDTKENKLFNFIETRQNNKDVRRILIRHLIKKDHSQGNL